jgi:purine-binding chemotaxis protein CheW
VAVAGEPVDESARYLTFSLHGEAYALDIFHVTEIIEHRGLTVVPMTPDFIRGVINLRGRAVPVIDLALRFGKAATEIGRRTSVIIVRIADAAAAEASGEHADGQHVGILVDAVNKVVTFTPDDIEPPPSFGAGIRADFISGMAKRENDFIIVLAVDCVLSVRDMAELASAAQLAGGAPPADAGS